ncbi:MAG: NYN domain-containing protein [Clostridiales bacterium]|nr:NYN domain-containing protein [Candidatus Crickella merdequi]
MGNSRRLTVGLLAHVDAGKTTLSEALLYSAGVIRKRGRVDSKDAFFDSDEQERARGITIYSKQAELTFGDTAIMLLDTPGHVDFSAEMERTLRVLDYAILIINGKDGVQQHTRTLWRLLEEYSIPTFIWVNKMDLNAVDKEGIRKQLSEELASSCVEAGTEEFLETAALYEDSALERFLETGEISDEEIVEAILARKLFPCYYGSALKDAGVDNLIEGILRYSAEKEYKNEFAARVYKITRDEKGGRLTHMKVTGGSFKVKDLIRTGESEEKINQIRIYSGEKYRTVDEAAPGMIVAVAGPENTYAGQSLGADKAGRVSALDLGVVREIQYPSSVNSFRFIQNMMLLEEEHPELQLYVTEEKALLVRIMGEVQLEVLEKLILQRLGIAVKICEYIPPVYEEIIEEVIEEEDNRIDLNSRWMPGHTGGAGVGEDLDDELKRIFESTYGKPKDTFHKAAEVRTAEKVVIKKEEILPEYILIDGYNVIFAWDKYKELARINIDSAREALIEELCNYKGRVNAEVIVVFDAYRVKGGVQRTERQGNIFVVYTGEAESADTYIERTSYELRKKRRVRVVTSDVAEQIIILSNNAIPVQAENFRKEVDAVNEELRQWMEEYARREKLANLNRISIEKK